MNASFKILLALTLQCLYISSFAGEMGPIENDENFRVYIPDLTPGFELSASALILQPGAGNLGWAAITTVLPIPTPEWRVQTFNPSFQAGFNVGARYIFRHSGTDLQLNWSNFQANYNNAVHVDPASQWVSPFSQTGTPPTGGEITGVASLKSATATLNFNYNAVNLDVGKYVNFGSNVQTRFFTGLGSAWIKQQLNAHFYGAPKATLSFNNLSTYAGAGPRLGLNNDIDVSHGIHLVGQLAGEVLIGTMQPAQYQFTAIASDLSLVGIAVNNEQISSSKVSQVVPEVDAKIGLSYSYAIQKNHELTLEVGYMGALYINPLASYETNTNVIALDSGSLSTSSVKHVQSNFSVAGPYVTARYKC